MAFKGIFTKVVLSFFNPFHMVTRMSILQLKSYHATLLLKTHQWLPIALRMKYRLLQGHDQYILSLAGPSFFLTLHPLLAELQQHPPSFNSLVVSSSFSPQRLEPSCLALPGMLLLEFFFFFSSLSFQCKYHLFS